MSQRTNEDLIRHLMALGMATGTVGALAPDVIADLATVVGGTTQNEDNTLNSVALDDEWLSQRKRGAIIVAWGTTAANGNTKDIKLFLGASAILTLADQTNNAKDFAFIAFLFSDGVDSQRGFGIALMDGAVVAGSSINFTATEDANVAKTIKTTGNNNSAAASAATGKGLVVIPLANAA